MKHLFSFRKLLFIFATLHISCFAYGQTADDYRTAASGNWNVNATWQRYDGSAWVNVNGVAPNTIPNSGDGVITIRNTHTVTVTANVTTDQSIVEAGGQININSSRTLTVANGTGTDLVINGTIDNSGTVTTTGTVSFGANSTYTHNRNGGTIPTATWDAASACVITGVTDNIPGGLAQTFGNFNWNCTGQTSNENMNGALTAIAGNFTVTSTGTGGDELRLTNGTDVTINIGGDLILSGGSLLFTNNNADVTVNIAGDFLQSGGSLDFSDDNQIGVLILNVSGDFSQSGGSFDFASGDANTTRTPALNLSGDFSQSGSATMTTSTSDADIVNGTITFNKNGAQTFSIATQANLTYTNFIIAATSTLELHSSLTLSSISTNNWAGSFTVNSGGTLNAQTYQVLSSTGAGAGTNNDFVLSSGANIITAEPDGIQSGNNGTISTSIANRTYSSGANYTYSGTATQNSGTFTTTPAANQVNNFTVNNSAGSTGVTLQQAFAIAGTCYFTAGLVTTTSTNLLIFNDNAIASGANNNVSDPSYVNGPVRKIGNDAFTFPVGKSGSGYHYCGISAPGSTTDAFEAEYMRASAAGLGTVTASGLDHVSNCEYWKLDRTTGSSNVNVTLSWNGTSNCSAAAYINDLATLVVAHFGTSWDAFGNDGGTSGSVTDGSVTWNNVSNFSPFSLGSTDNSNNPLPVKFVNVRAYTAGEKNRIEWTNMTESEIGQYEVERSADGITFTLLSSVPARSNNAGKEEYAVLDHNTNAPVIWYRIRAIEFDGTFVYSPIVKVNRSQSGNTKLVLYPNPVTTGQLTIQLYSNRKENYSITVYTNTGQQVFSTSWQHSGGSASRSVELPGSLAPGYYHLQVSGGGKMISEKFILQ